MAFTGRLGTDDSQFGNLELGSEGEGLVERTATDSVSLSEAVERSGVFSRSATDAPTTSESVTRGVDTSRVATNAVVLSDSAESEISSGEYAATTEEAIATSEAVARQLTVSRSAADSPTTSESGSRSGGFTRGAADGPTISESASAEIVIVPNAFQSSAFQSSPAFQTEQGVVVRTASDAVVLSEDARALTGEIADATDSVTVSATASVNKAARRSVTQTVTLSSPATRSGTFSRTATESVSVSATARPGFVYPRTSSDSVTATDATTAEKSYVRTAKDSTTGATSVWPMNDAGSSLRDDRDSNPLTASGTIPTYQVSSPTGGGVAFNQSAYFQNASPTGLPVGAADRSIEFWFKGTSTSKQTIFSYGTNTTRRSYSIAINEGGSSRIGVWTFNDDGSVSAPGINNNTWHRVTVTFDGTTTSFYMDGALLGTDTYGGALNTLVSAAGLVVGRDHHTAANFARSGSSVSGLRFWDRALSAAEVAGDTIARSAVLARVYHYEAATATDIATRSVGHFRAISDTTTTTESTGELVGEAYDRTATDAVTLSESATQTTANKFRTATDGQTDLCLDFDSGPPAGWTNDGFTVVSGELFTGSGEFNQLEYAGSTPTGPTTLQFDFRTPDPIDDDYWFVEVDSYGMYVFVDNWYGTNIGDAYGLYTTADSIETGWVEVGPLVADTWYTVKAFNDHATGVTRAKIWLQGDPEPGAWQAEGVDTSVAAYPWGIYAEVVGAGDMAVDNVCWSALASVTDSVARTLVATRTATEDEDTVEWIVNGGTVDTPVYGQVPNGYQPQLAAPINATQTTITVTQPLPPGTDLPILVFLPDGFEYVLVTAVSPDGLTWTVVRGQNQTAGTTHSGGSVLPANTTVSIGGIDYTAYVLLNKMRLTTYANGQVGTGEIGIFLAGSFVATGAEVVVRHRNVRVWGGYIANIKRTYPFPAGGGEPGQDVGWSTLEVVDYNILLRKRIYHDKDTPTHMKVKQWPNGTHDDVVIGHMLAHFLNIGGDGLSFDLHHVGTPGLRVDSCDPNFTDYFQIAWAGYTWQDAMRAVADETGAVYYIDPDKTFRYVDDSTKQSVFGYTGLSDDPGGSVIGYRDFELSSDGTKLVNEQFTWGMGQGATEPVLGHEFDSGSVTEHGLWQQAEVRFDMYCQGTVDLRAQTWLDGSPQNRRGHKNNRVAARATVFTPYFRVADVITLESTTFNFSDTIPIRGAEITFPTPWDIQNVLTISHEKDTPWEAYEFAFPDFPRFDIDFDPIDPIDPWTPYDPCAEPSPPVVTGGGTPDATVFPPSQVVTRGALGWDSEDDPPSGAAYWEFSVSNKETTTYQRVFFNPTVYTTWGIGFEDRVYHSGIFRTPTGAIDEGPAYHTRSSGYRTFRAPDNEVTPNAPVYAHLVGTVLLTGVMTNRPGYPDVAGFQTGLVETPLPAHNVVLSLLLEDGITVTPDALLPVTGDGFQLNHIGSPFWEGALTEGVEVEVDTYVSVPAGKHFALSAQISTGEGVETELPDGLLEFVWSGDNISVPASVGFFIDTVTFSHTEPAGPYATGPCPSHGYEAFGSPPGSGTLHDMLADEPDGTLAGYVSDLASWTDSVGGFGGFNGYADDAYINLANGCRVDTLMFEVTGLEDAVDGPLDPGEHGYSISVWGSSTALGGFSGLCTFYSKGPGSWDVSFPTGPGGSYVVEGSVTGNPLVTFSYDTIGQEVLVSAGGFSQAFPFTGGVIDDIWLSHHVNYRAPITVAPIANYATMTISGGPDPCADTEPGELQDPDEGALYGQIPLGGVALENGNFLYTFAQQFLPSSTEVWADGLRLRLTEDYTEHPENAAIEIHSDAQSGFTVFDPNMSIVVNMVPFVTHDPPPEYVEP